MKISYTFFYYKNDILKQEWQTKQCHTTTQNHDWTTKYSACQKKNILIVTT